MKKIALKLSLIFGIGNIFLISNVAYASSLNNVQFSAKIEQSNSLIAQNNDPYSLILKALELYEQGEYKDAIATFDQVLRIDPEFSPAWLGKAMVLYDLGRYEESLASSNKAIDLNIEVAEAFGIKGHALYMLERYDEAVDSYNEAIKIEPDYIEAWFNKGRALYSLERYNEAIAALTEVINLQQNYAQAYALRGAIYGIIGDMPKAISDLEVAADLFYKAKDYEAYQKIAELLKEISG